MNALTTALQVAQAAPARKIIPDTASSDLLPNWGSLQAPYSQEAEEATLGAVLVNPNAYFDVAAFLNADDFFILRHRYIWEAIDRLKKRDEVVDYLTVIQELKDAQRLNEIGGAAYLIQLINSTPTSVHAVVYGKLVFSFATRRRIMAASDEIKALALNSDIVLDEVCIAAQSKLDAVMPDAKKEILAGRDSIQAYKDIQYETDLKIANGELVTYPLPKEWGALKELVPSIRPGNFIVISSDSGYGKSAFVEQLGEHTALLGIPTEYIHTEQSQQEILHRRMARHSGLSFDLLLTSGHNDLQQGFTAEQARRMNEADEHIAQFANKLSYEWMPDVRFEKLQTQMRRAALAGVKVFIIDHFQDITVDARDPVRAYEQACIWLAAFAEFRQVVVVVVSQVNKQGKTKWTEKLKEKATLLITIKAPNLDNCYTYYLNNVEYSSFPGQKSPVTDVIVVKARFGKTGKVKQLRHGPGFKWLDLNSVRRQPDGFAQSFAAASFKDNDNEVQRSY